MVRQFAELESQSRLEVARLNAEVREAKLERDKAVKDLHAFQLESHNWKQEIVAAKASVGICIISGSQFV